MSKTVATGDASQRITRMIMRANAMLGYRDTEWVKFIGGTRGFDLRFSSQPTKAEKAELNRLFVSCGFSKMRFDRTNDTSAKIFPKTQGGAL